MTHSLTLPTSRAQRYLAGSKAANTVRAYRAAWGAFQRYCQRHGLSPLPATAETLVAYIAEMAKHYRVSTIDSHLAAIYKAHKLAEHESPTKSQLVEMTMEGVRREHGTRPTRKSPVTRPILRRLISTLPANTLAGLRDRALLLIGFAGAFRRSELVAIKIQHCEFSEGGVKILLPRSKTDQHGHGEYKHIPYTTRGGPLCAATALRSWLSAANLTSGPVFRRVWCTKNGIEKVGRAALNDKHVARLVKNCVTAAGLRADEFAGHSLRSGFVTQGFADGVPLPHIQKVTGHKSERVLMTYERGEGKLERQAVATVLEGD